MVFGHWQIGIHIQQDGVFGVALVCEKGQWALRRWWHLPLEPGVIADGKINQPEKLTMTLLPWSKTLPRRHHIRLAFPAERTLQRKIPQPAMRLREREQVSWVANTLARELEMAHADLRFDYAEDTLKKAWSVTAAQRKEVAVLLELAESLHLHISAITPDACALQRLLPGLSPPANWLAWRDSTQWLWATRYSWGRQARDTTPSLDELARQLGLQASEGQVCNVPDTLAGFDPWCAIPHRQPPLPSNGDAYAVAIGLALGAQY